MKHLKQASIDDKRYSRPGIITPQVEILDQDIFNVGLAGLMHDLGHGIYSHLFDRDFMPIILKYLLKIKQIFRQHGIEWEHEDASVMLFNYLVDENNIDLDRENIRFV